MTTALAALPEWVKSPLRRIRNTACAAFFYGTGRFCPVCGKSSRRFRRYGRVLREDAQCVRCDALERHRFLWLFLSQKTDLFDGKSKTVLHVAPEPCFEARFKDRLGARYLTADLFNPRAMVKMDITDIHYPDESFDVVYCSHVLEHVLDDRQAMREFARVLKTDGWAILLVPITSDTTFEDSSVVEPQDRLRVFGQEDHVRKYGPDYVDRLRDAGFRVATTNVEDMVQTEEAKSMGLTSASGEIFVCTK